MKLLWMEFRTLPEIISSKYRCVDPFYESTKLLCDEIPSTLFTLPLPSTLKKISPYPYLDFTLLLPGALRKVPI